ncbi:MAG: SDR family NAD(P)-dependent oxidoreductase [Lachnospiraceae bacterium]|nr:SDR family NAD(P)-dependent oxidoreductase [Lachnospiraceae bacterium]
MNHNLEGKIAVITGGGGGIGSAVAESLGARGAKVALCGGNNLAKLEATAAKVTASGGEAYLLPGNLMEDSFTTNCIEQIASHFGGIDYLINNAGMALSCPFEETTMEQFDQILRLNTRVPYQLCQKVLPYLRKSQSAEIINISSVVGHLGYPLQSAYAASKHAIIGFSKSLANEVYNEGIRVHTICPGGVFTDMVKIARPDLSSEGMIMPQDIANIVLFFLENHGNAVVDEICVHRAGKEPFAY